MSPRRCSVARADSATASPRRSSSRRSAWCRWATVSAGWAAWCWSPHEEHHRAVRRARAPGRARSPPPPAAEAECEPSRPARGGGRRAPASIGRVLAAGAGRGGAPARFRPRRARRRRRGRAQGRDRALRRPRGLHHDERAARAGGPGARAQRLLPAHERRHPRQPGPRLTFLGDGILAFFGALQPNPWQCDDAVNAALAMQASMREYNVELAREGLPALAVGIGIHRGPGLAGLVGSRERRENAFVGRTVNLAARVQTLTRVHQAEILVTDALRAELDDRFVLVAMPPEIVKGIDEPVVTYAVQPPPRRPPRLRARRASAYWALP